MASHNETELRINQAEQIPRRNRKHVEQQFIRNPVQVETKDIEREPMKYIALALVHLKNSFSRVPNMLEDFSRPVDEYVVQGFSPGTVPVTGIEVNPQWETNEIIKSIIITGPAGTVTLVLGDRTWTLTIPASGIIVIAPIALILDRSDLRLLTPQAPGTYSVELMGNTDARGQLV